MANLDDDFDADSDAEEGKKKIDRKKILIFLLPAVTLLLDRFLVRGKRS